MTNQFDAKIRFDPIAWLACDEETDTALVVKDLGTRASWEVRFPDGRVEKGFMKDPAAARAKARRVVEKACKKKT